MSEKEPFYFTKAAGGFADVTRWLKDSFGTIRGLVALGLAVCAIFGCVYIGKRIVDRFFPKKETPQVGTVAADNGATVQTIKIEKQKNGFLNLL